jgi:cellulose synthase (UDP-forming)
MLELLDWPGFDDLGLTGWLILLWLGLMLATSIWAPRAALLRLSIAGTILALLLRYLVWRLTETIPDAEDYSFGAIWRWIFLLVELPALGGIVLLWLFQSRFVDRSAQATRLAAAMTEHPMVDVFVPTYNEAEAILERTIAGAQQMTYSRFRIWLLDDGKRETMRALAAQMKVGYLARPDNAHAKAGNMNYALAHVMALDEKPAYIGILDADFVPTPAFLSRTVPFFSDPGVGLVQTPQHFFNPDPLQVNLKAERILPDDQRFAQCVDLPARDAWGIATSCGTSSIVRVESLLQIGGFPYESVCEDTLTSVKLWTLGQRTVFLNEPLTQGLAVEGVAELLGQRGRWSLGNMQIVRSDWGPFSRKRLPFLGRLFLLSMISGSIVSPVMRLLIIASPAVYLCFGVLAIPVDVTALALYLGPFLLAHYVGLAWISRGANLPIITEAITTIEYFSTFRAGLVGLFKPKGHKFKVTAKGIQRDAAVIHWNIVGALICPIIVYIVGMIYNIAIYPAQIENSESLLIVGLWCYYNILLLICAIYMAIDLPRTSRQDIFHVGLPARLRIGDDDRRCVVRTLSPSAATIDLPGWRPVPGNETIALVLSNGFRLPVGGVQVDKRRVELTFAIDRAEADRLSRFLFSGSAINSVEQCSMPRAFWTAILRTVR